MRGATRGWIAAAFMACFLAVGLPYWRIPYHAVSLPNSLWGAGLVAVGLVALLLRASRRATFGQATLAAGAAVPAAIYARVSVETGRDPTSHNLWPFEVAIALGVGGCCSLAGALAGSALAWWTGRSSPASGGPS